MKGAEHYLSGYSGSRISEWLIKAAKFPSVLEHVTFTFLIEGISRVTSHQLVRHRIASYTQESQRYSAVSGEYVIPPTIKGSEDLEREYVELIRKSLEFYRKLISSGIPYEDARYVLPQAVTTRLVMTVNLRELLHIACLRLSSEAQWEIRELVKRMIEEAGRVVPEVQDILKEVCKSDSI